MHLDKKTITLLIGCTLAGGVIGGLIGGAIGSHSSRGGNREYRNGRAMMGQNNDSYNRGGMMGQGRTPQEGQQAYPASTAQPVSTTTKAN